jgi:hypothetical protein
MSRQYGCKFLRKLKKIPLSKKKIMKETMWVTELGGGRLEEGNI